MNYLKVGLGGAVLALGLVACPGNDAPITPTKASVNGYAINGDKSANLNVSALDSGDKVLRKGTLSDPLVSNASLLSWRVRQMAGTPVTATASVCGNIDSQSGALTSGILLDASGSMASTDPDKKRAAAAKAFVARLQGSDVAAVTSFSSGEPITSPYTELTVHQSFTSNRTQLETAIDAAAVNGGTTPLWKSTAELVDLLKKQGGSNKVGLVLTDGAANDSDLLQGAIDAAKSAGVRLLMLGLGTPDTLDETDMQRAATDSGGVYAVADTAADLNTIFNGAFNATQGAGCLKLVFTPAPTPGNKITGTLGFKVNGTQLSAPFTIQY